MNFSSNNLHVHVLQYLNSQVACLITYQLPLTIQLWLNMKILLLTPWCPQRVTSPLQDKLQPIRRGSWQGAVYCVVWRINENWATFEVSSVCRFYYRGSCCVSAQAFYPLSEHSFMWWRWSILHSPRPFFLCFPAHDLAARTGLSPLPPDFWQWDSV